MVRRYLFQTSGKRYCTKTIGFLLFHNNPDTIFPHKIHNIWCFNVRLWHWVSVDPWNFPNLLQKQYNSLIKKVFLIYKKDKELKWGGSSLSLITHTQTPPYGHELVDKHWSIKSMLFSISVHGSLIIFFFFRYHINRY